MMLQARRIRDLRMPACVGRCGFEVVPKRYMPFGFGLKELHTCPCDHDAFGVDSSPISWSVRNS